MTVGYASHHLRPKSARRAYTDTGSGCTPGEVPHGVAQQSQRPWVTPLRSPFAPEMPPPQRPFHRTALTR